MIKTERLNIRPASIDEMKVIIEIETTEEMKSAYGEMLSGAVAHPEHYLWYTVWLIENSDGDTVGDLCFKGISEDGAVEIGYGIYDEFQGVGYATEAVGALTKWAIGQKGVTRVEAEAEPTNLKSQRVLEKCNYKPNGVIGEEGPRFVYVGE